jgi:hypothetical protein
MLRGRDTIPKHRARLATSFVASILSAADRVCVLLQLNLFAPKHELSPKFRY